MDGPDVESHYDRRDDLTEHLLAALRDAGVDTDDLARADLAGVEEFHVRGREATRALARDAALGDGDRVLDVGCGLGGPARTLAVEFDCRVVGLDRTRPFVRAAHDLTRRVGVDGCGGFVSGDALALPFADGSFDAVLLQHVTPNVPDETRLFAELARVLGPGGRLAVHEIFVPGSGEPVHYPVPFARGPADASLSTPGSFVDRARDAGLEPVDWTDDTDACLAWYDSMEGPPAVGFDAVMGPDFPEMGRNMRRNLAEGRAAVWRGVFERE
jgi:SAM-dependent methyltransferase